jgi:hypothetical protein
MGWAAGLKNGMVNLAMKNDKGSKVHPTIIHLQF